MSARTFLVALLAVLLLIAVGRGGGAATRTRHQPHVLDCRGLQLGSGQGDPGDRQPVRAGGQHQGQANGDREDQPQSQIASASAAGSLPDVPAAASSTYLRPPTASPTPMRPPPSSTPSAEVPSPSGGLGLVEANGQPVAVPSDSWTQLLVYRKDLFAKAGLAAPTSFQAIRAAATKLTGDEMAGIVAATKPTFTQQTFEYLAVANGCQLTNQAGAITYQQALSGHLPVLRSRPDLLNGSVLGGQDAPTPLGPPISRPARRAMHHLVVVSPGRAGRACSDACPTCPQCRADPPFLADHSGIVTAITGLDGTQPSQFGELTCFARPSPRTPTKTRPSWSSS